MIRKRKALTEEQEAKLRTYKREYARRWRADNPEKNRKARERFKKTHPSYMHEYNISNKRLEANRKMRLDPEFIKKKRERDKKWILNRTEKQKRKRKEAYERYLSTPNGQIAHSLRRRMANAVKNHQKSGSAVRDLGCSISELWKRLESMFEPGMTRENYGRGSHKWTIDHVIPLSRFDLADRKQFLKACHYTNLQPMWFVDNVRKGNRVRANPNLVGNSSAHRMCA